MIQLKNFALILLASTKSFNKTKTPLMFNVKAARFYTVLNAYIQLTNNLNVIYQMSAIWRKTLNIGNVQIAID